MPVLVPIDESLTRTVAPTAGSLELSYTMPEIVMLRTVRDAAWAESVFLTRMVLPDCWN